MKYIVTMALVLGWTTSVAAQEPVRITLDDAIEMALSDGYTANDILLQLERAQEGQRAASGRFKTNADLELSSPDFAERFEPATDADTGATTYFAQRTTRWSSTLRLNQPLPTDGELSLWGSLRQVDQVNLDADAIDSSDFFTSLSLNFRQPLFVPNGLKLQLERADLELEQSEIGYTRTQLNVIYNTTATFFDAYETMRRAEIAADTARQQERSYQLAKTKFEAGLIPEVEALQMAVDLAQSQADQVAASGRAERSEEDLKIALGLDPEVSVVAEIELAVPEFEVDEELAVEHSLKHRFEIREGQIRRRLSEISLEETDAQRAIKGELTAFYDLTGISDASLGHGTSTRRLFDSSWADLRERPNNRGLAFSLTVPLWDSGVNGAEVAAARISLEQDDRRIQEDRRVVAKEVRATITQLRDARQSLRVLAQSEEVAARSYEISLARFENGEITTQELALDRERLSQARLSYLGAYVQLRLSIADLKRKTLYDFEENRSLVSP